RILRAHELDELIGALKIQVVRDSALGPVPRDDRLCGVESAFVDTLNDRNLKMKDGQLLAYFDCREPANALVGAVQCGDKMLLIIVGHVELKTQTEAVGFHRALPHAFHAGDGIARLFRSGPGGLTMKGKRKSHIAL